MPIMKRLHARLLALFIAGTCTAPGALAQRLYDVEIIVFSHNTGQDLGETWQQPVDGAGRARGQFQDNRFTELSSSRYRLEPVRYSLQSEGAYTVLFHRAWRQQASSPSNIADYPLHSFSNEANSSVEGAISLVRGRYLHLDVDLLLMKAAGGAPGQYSDGPGNTPAYRLREKRRIKSSELQYFDHPRFGLIAMVTPYSESQPATEAVPAEPAEPAAMPDAETAVPQP